MDYLTNKKRKLSFDDNEDSPNPYREVYKRRKLIDTSINHPLIYTINKILEYHIKT